MLLEKSFSTADQNFSRPLVRFSDKYVRGPRLLVKKPTGGFDNGLGAILIGEHSLASFSFEKIVAWYFGTFATKSATSGLMQCRKKNRSFDHLVGGGE